MQEIETDNTHTKHVGQSHMSEENKIGYMNGKQYNYILTLAPFENLSSFILIQNQMIPLGDES